MAAASDYFKKVGEGTITTLAAPGKAEGADSINLASSPNWPEDTGVVLAIRRVDANGDLIAGTYTEWEGVLSGTTVSDLNLVAGTDQAYAAGSATQVYIPVSAERDNDIVTGILVGHNQDGTHKSSAIPNGSVTESKLASDAVTTVKIDDDAVTTPKIDDGAITTDKINDDAVTASKVADGAIDAAAKIGNGIITSDKLVEAFLRGRYQSDNNNTIANSAPTGLTIQFGWGQIQGDNSSQVQGTVTLPTAFSSTLMVIVGSVDARTAGVAATLGALTNSPGTGGWTAFAGDITATDFQITLLRSDGVNFDTGAYYGFSWIAIGTV